MPLRRPSSGRRDRNPGRKADIPSANRLVPLAAANFSGNFRLQSPSGLIKMARQPSNSYVSISRWPLGRL